MAGLTQVPNLIQVQSYLKTWVPQGWSCSLEDAGVLRAVDKIENTLVVHLELPFAGTNIAEDLPAAFKQTLLDTSGTQELVFETTIHVATLKPQHPERVIAGVKNIIAVSSGKGGVGKSTVALNLVLALKQEGAKVGILDADIYGPSIPMMLGCVEEKPSTPDDKKMYPVQRYGVVANSIGFLVNAQDATVWRGPMASKVLQQLLLETLWGDLDYLIVDLPPGTGDIQLTLAQQVPTTAAVVVTTPQNIALADAIKGVRMFQKVAVPVLGVIENMSYFQCPSCGHKTDIFGQGGGEDLATDHGLPLLAQLPLDASMRQSADQGQPLLVDSPNHPQSLSYKALARELAARLYFGGEVVPTRLFVTSGL